MPSRALRVCTQPGCGNLVEHGRCEKHAYPDRSGKNPKYDSAYWRAVRAGQLRRYPLCERHLKRGLAVPALEVHHRDGNPANDDPANLESLCRPCHSEHTAREHGGFGNRKRCDGA